MLASKNRNILLVLMMYLQSTVFTADLHIYSLLKDSCHARCLAGAHGIIKLICSCIGEALSAAISPTRSSIQQPDIRVVFVITGRP